MSTSLVSAYALYKAPHFTGYDGNNLITLNGDRIQAFTPRAGYLKRYLVPGQNQIQYLLTFEPTSADLADTNTLTGIYIEQDGEGVLIDCISVANAEAALSGTGSITTKYIGQSGGIPLFVSPTATAYCLVRSDNGSAYAVGQVATQYVGQYYGNVQLRSNFSNVSHYTLYSFTVPVPQLNIQPGISAANAVLDVITAGACSS